MIAARIILAHKSHPVRVRGLKRGMCRFDRPCCSVAPRAGAWVETHGMIEI